MGHRSPAGIRRLPPGELVQHLGSETDLLVFDATLGFDVDAFAIAIGLVRGGGAFLLLTPPLESWPWQQDTCLESWAVHGWPVPRPSRFLQRLARIFQSFEPPRTSVRFEATGGPSEPMTLTRDQSLALEAIQRVALGHPRRPLLLVADRGRGKSAVLGRAAGELAAIHQKRILVTAPRRSATQILFAHAREALSRSPTGSVEGAPVQGGLAFVAPDRLLRENPETDLLLVDEAAGIPLPLLLELIRCYPRVVLSSTVHGYEGSGRGFEVRLSHHLERLRPGWKRCELRQPVRWADNDPLERLGYRALLLDAEPPSWKEEPPSPDECHLRRITLRQLLDRPELLESAFGLMMSAHYRTTPRDLRYLLDAPNLRLFLLEARGRVLGVALVAEEGNLPGTLQQEILEGKRRPRGHLLPQALATRCQLPEALQARCWRVVRIAIHPALQGQGLGSRLLAAVEAQARQQEIELLGASFGATPELARFWRRAGYSPLRLGHRREASSGAHALLVARPLGPLLEKKLHQVHARFQDYFPLQLGQLFTQLEPELALALRDPPATPMPEDSKTLLSAYARERCSYLDALGVLHQLACRQHAPSSRKAQLLVTKVLQGRSWKEVATHFDFSGKGQAEAALRRAVLDLISP